jgi:hypothetical protein
MLALAERVYIGLIWFGVAIATGFVGWVSLELRVPPSIPSSPTLATIAPTPKPVGPRLPARLAEAMHEGTVVHSGPFAWPKGGASVVVDEHDGWLRRWSFLVWSRGSDSGVIPLPREAGKVVIRDVAGDRDPELVIFAKQPSEPSKPFSAFFLWQPEEAMAWIVGIGWPNKPMRKPLREMQLLGATDEASLDRELATTTLALTPESSPLKLIARLPLATSSEIRALVGPKGLRLCASDPDGDPDGPPRKCRTVARDKLDTKLVAEPEVRAAIVGFPEPRGPADEPTGCGADGATGAHITCLTFTSSSCEGGRWRFERIHGMLRLVEIAVRNACPDRWIGRGN